MSATTSTLAIITARGGSKRIPRKNIRLFRDKPMLLWSVEAALTSGVFTTVMVSTDDREIAELAQSAGAEVPFMRSGAASDDYSTTTDVLKEVLCQYQSLGKSYELCCCLYPTAPFVTAVDLQDGYKQLLAKEYDAIFPVTAFSYPIWRSLKRDTDGRVHLNFPNSANERSQDLPTAFHDAGQWYWFRSQPFLETGTLLGDNTGSIVVPELNVQDIDTEEDWILAELKHERLFTPRQ